MPCVPRLAAREADSEGGVRTCDPMLCRRWQFWRLDGVFDIQGTMVPGGGGKGAKALPIDDSHFLAYRIYPHHFFFWRSQKACLLTHNIGSGISDNGGRGRGGGPLGLI